MKYGVVQISKNLVDYPWCRVDTLAFPHLVKFVDDEQATFVVCEDGSYCLADEFFHTHNVRFFEVLDMGVP